MRQFSLVLGVMGLLAGFVIAISVLSGDAQGRVNLLYLLLLFVFLPVASLLLSGVFLIRKSSRGLAGWLLELPLWPAVIRQQVLALTPGNERKFWLLYQTQLLGLAFAIGGLAAFLLLLIGTDISFVWRSTLLQATDLLPVLKFLAIPWAFWSDAQPTLALLQQSQDFRLATPELTAAELGQWWKYAFAAQVTYMVLPRAVMALVARAVYLGSNGVDDVVTKRKVVHVDSPNTVPMQGQLAPLVTTVKSGYLLIDWGSVPMVLAEALFDQIGKPGDILRAGPLTEFDPDRLQQLDEGTVVVAVKAWEPPMGELQDYLRSLPADQGLQTVLLPLDWNNEGLHQVKDGDLQEWRRFCGTLDNWSVLQPGSSAGASV